VPVFVQNEALFEKIVALFEKKEATFEKQVLTMLPRLLLHPTPALTMRGSGGICIFILINSLW
jgi:hypothetical protein